MSEWLAGLPEWAWTMIAFVGAFLTMLARKRRSAQEAHKVGDGSESGFCASGIGVEPECHDGFSDGQRRGGQR